MPGFLPFARGTLMLDFVVLALFFVIPILAYSIYLVRVKRAYTTHKWIQLWTGTVLIVVVLLFELEMRIFGWRHLAEPSPYYNTLVFPVLIFHIIVAVLTIVTWVVAIFGAYRKFDWQSPQPNRYSRLHRRLGRVAALSLTTTAVSGWVFYYLAFVAT